MYLTMRNCKKLLLGLVAMILFGLVSSYSQAQQLSKNVKSKTDTNSVALQKLLNPSLQNLLIPVPNGSALNSFPYIKPLGGANKFFLKFGANLIRGNNDKYPFYSLKDTWKYPGPTLRYPETATEYELFLEHYSLFNPNSQ